MNIVWFKRDLRIGDHAPLARAAANGPVHGLYIYEPEMLAAADYDPIRLAFTNACLRELDRELRKLGAWLDIRVGDGLTVLQAFHRENPDMRLWAHEETGNALSYARDRAVRAWCRTSGIRFSEIPQHGVVRRLTDRDGWSGQWNQRMRQPITNAPEAVQSARTPQALALLSASELGLDTARTIATQSGGISAAHATLNDFLAGRGAGYRDGMSSPVSAWDACSRLSPYFAYGAISMREVHQTVEAKRSALRAGEIPDADPRWKKSLSSFSGRLRWHCHFMQKLEDEPTLEFANLSRAYDGLRENDFDAQRFRAWCDGQTGYPMVDACMRALQQTGWINFRMRAMLMSFASYHLWLHWREPSLHLARMFLDFEPGIHYSQCQMQSGTTGINTVRIYSPAKQVKDQDPEGRFIREFLPELADVPNARLAEPQTMSDTEQREAGCRIGQDYPAPIVDHATAYKDARSKMYARRREANTREEAQRVYAKHGSRRRPSRARSRSA